MFFFHRIKSISGYAFAGTEHIEILVINDNPIKVINNTYVINQINDNSLKLIDIYVIYYSIDHKMLLSMTIL